MKIHKINKKLIPRQSHYGKMYMSIYINAPTLSVSLIYRWTKFYQTSVIGLTNTTMYLQAAKQKSINIVPKSISKTLELTVYSLNRK